MSDTSRFWALPAEHAETILRDMWLLQHPAEAASFQGVSDETGRAPYLVSGSTAFISIDGPLSRDAQYSFWGGRISTGYDEIRSDISAAMDDPRVSSIMLDINSPGGSVAGVQELASFIAECSRKKTMAAYTNGLMASAAYWIGSATGHVYATETAEVGSIGVVMTLYDRVEANRKAGINVHVISSGALKSAGNPHLELTDEQRSYFQDQADGIHAVFRGSVASAMGLDAGTAEAWGDGQIFLASAAIEKGLVSGIVSGIVEASKRLMEESIMDRATLEAQAPDLVAELKAEGRAEAERADLSGVFLDCARNLMSAAAFGRLEKFMGACREAAMTPDQARAMAEVTFSGASAEDAEAEASAEVREESAAEKPAEADARAEVLKALLAAASRGVDAAAPVNPLTVGDALGSAARKLGE